jgi:molybdate transport system substrate-binding protein
MESSREPLLYADRVPGPPARRCRRAAPRVAACLLLATAFAWTARAELRVGAAVSLRESLPAIGADYERTRGGAPVSFAFGATNVIAAQVRAGAPLDLILCADERIALELAAQAESEAPVPFAGNRLTVLAARELALPIDAPGDLAQPGVRRIAVPEHAVPVGRYARAWLRRHGLESRLAGRIVRTEHARATLTAVDQGHADLAIVYTSDARLARSARVALEIPAGEQPRIAYAAAVVRGARGAALARDFVRYLLEPEAQARLAAAGLAPPPPASAR